MSAEETRVEVARELTKLVKETVPPEIFTQVEIRCGVEAAEIVNEAKKVEADIVILSTHGRTGRAHSLVGSVAEDVVRLAPCPVLVVRERQHEFIKFHTGSKTISKTVTANAA